MKLCTNSVEPQLISRQKFLRTRVTKVSNQIFGLLEWFFMPCCTELCHSKPQICKNSTNKLLNASLTTKMAQIRHHLMR